MSILIELLRTVASDPMWANHCEISKSVIIKTADEIERLTAALKVANANHERFEREWYLRGDEIDRLQRALDAAAVDNEQYRQANDLLTRELDKAREQLWLANIDQAAAEAELAEEVASHDKTREIQTAAQVHVLMLNERLAEARELLALVYASPDLNAKIGEWFNGAGE